MPTFITIREAANQTHLSYYFIRKLFSEGKIKGVRIGKKIMLNADELSEVLKKLSEGGVNG